jgi:YVTN family beta-propeller protein
MKHNMLVPANRTRGRSNRAVLALAILVGCSGQGTGEVDDTGASGVSTKGPGIPNADHPASELFKRISPVMSTRHMNQPAVVNQALVLAGNAVHEIWNISNPTHPVKMSEMVSPFHDGEAEAQQVSYARFADGSLHFVTTSGKGIDIFNISDPSKPFLESAMQLDGVDYGDFTSAVWGVAWQGNFIYVGGTNTGLSIVDVTNPRAPKLVKRVPNSQFGGINAGPVFAIGNLLVITTPKDNAGVATMDISDPANPSFLNVVVPTEKSYIGGFYGTQAHLLTPFRSFDVTTDPSAITLVASVETPRSEYMSFGENTLLLGSLRTAAGGASGIFKYDIRDVRAPKLLGHLVGRLDPGTDDQFSVPIGNLMVVADDQHLFGAYLAVHDTARDRTPPSVLYVNPSNGATKQALTTRIGVSFSDQIELTSATATSFIVRPVGGTALGGRWGINQTLLSFWPEKPLDPSTTYEIVMPAGGVTDVVGNGIANGFRSTFTTGTAADVAPSCGIDLSPVSEGGFAKLQPTGGAESRFTYSWNFGDGTAGAGASVSHAYGKAGRYPVQLKVTDPAGESTTGFDHYEAEDGTLSGGVVARSDRAGFSGSGFANYPSAIGPGVKVSRNDVAIGKAGTYAVQVRFANGDATGSRKLSLHVNGGAAQTLTFPGAGSWDAWHTVSANVSLNAGANTIDLVADAGTQGPNIDGLLVPRFLSTTCAAIQIVHHPLTAAKPTRASTIAIVGHRAWAVNPDAGTVTAVDLATRTRAFEAPVGDTPRTLAAAPDGTVWVTNQGDDTISVLDDGGAHVATIALPYGSRPYGIAFTPDGKRAFVTLEGPGRLARLDPIKRTLIDTLDFGPDANGQTPSVRGLAITSDSRRVLVSRFVSPQPYAAEHATSPNGKGELFEVNPDALTVVRTIALADSKLDDTPDQARGIPNYLSSISISPDGTTLWLPSKQDNMSRGAFRDGQSLTHDDTVRPIVSAVDLSSSAENVAARIDLNDSSMPFAAEMSPFGDLLFIAVQGNNRIDVRNAYTGRAVGSFSVDRAPEGVVLDANGILYVQNFLGRTMSILDVNPILKGLDATASTLATVALVGTEHLSGPELAGKKIFYNASDRRMSSEGYITCATCHLGGDSDGRVWDFTDHGEGLRNNITLLGRRGMAHGNVHWTGNFDEIQDFENDMRQHFSGEGFMTDDQFKVGTRSDPLGDPKAGVSAELDALAAFVSTLAHFPRSPFRNADGTLTADGVAGKAIFQSLDCTSCHSGAIMTDRTLHDVGTITASSGKRIGQPLTGIDTPTLRGVFATAPYHHNGTARTLTDVINVATHGNASTLPQASKDQLVSYLKQLDDND